MDPDTALNEILDMVTSLLEREAGKNDEAEELALRIEDLHRWISRGGLLPRAWRQKL